MCCKVKYNHFIFFSGQPAVDLGGIRRQFFTDLLRTMKGHLVEENTLGYILPTIDQAGCMLVWGLQNFDENGYPLRASRRPSVPLLPTLYLAEVINSAIQHLTMTVCRLL